MVAGSSGQMSAHRSDISTNSSERIRLTILGGRAAAGLYGPASCRTLDCSMLRAAEPSAASTSMSRGDFPLLGVKVSRDQSLRGSGSSPSSTRPEPALGEGGSNTRLIGLGGGGVGPAASGQAASLLRGYEQRACAHGITRPGGVRGRGAARGASTMDRLACSAQTAWRHAP